MTSVGGVRKNPPPCLPDSGMHHYSVFGRTICSEMLLPELVPREAPVPGLTVRQLHTAPPALPADARVAGSERIYDNIRATLDRHAAGWRITVDDTGIFDWDAASRTVTCWRRPEGTDDFLRAHLLGRVLGTILHDEGLAVLHGSAVVSSAGAIGFLAPKGFGKSSLALALARAGAPLLTDDTLAVDLHALTPSRPHASAAGAPSRPHALPGVTSSRLLPDSASALGVALASDARADGKHLAATPQGVRTAAGAAPLAAIYLLLPASFIEGDRAAAPAPLPATSAVAALTAHAKVGEMLGASGAPELLRRAAHLLAQVPVRGLVVTRNLARLDEAARDILAWHGGAPPSLPATDTP